MGIEHQYAQQLLHMVDHALLEYYSIQNAMDARPAVSEMRHARSVFH